MPVSPETHTTGTTEPSTSPRLSAASSSSIESVSLRVSRHELVIGEHDALHELLSDTVLDLGDRVRDRTGRRDPAVVVGDRHSASRSATPLNAGPSPRGSSTGAMLLPNVSASDESTWS